MGSTRSLRMLTHLGFFLLVVPVRGDVPAARHSFTNADGRFEFRDVETVSPENVPGKQWALIDKATGATKYTISGWFGGAEVFVSSDGAALGVIDDFVDGRPSVDTNLVTFYRNGQEVRRYSFGDLHIRPEATEISVTHFQWCVPFDPGWRKPSADDTFRLMTFDLRILTFDLAGCSLRSSDPDSRLTPDAILVSGTVNAVAGQAQGSDPRRFSVRPTCVLHGSIAKNESVEFGLDPGVPGDDVVVGLPGRRYRLVDAISYTVLIKDGRLLGAWMFAANGCVQPVAPWN